MWNRQHQEHVVSIEKLYTSRIKNLEDEISDVRRENEVLRSENSRLETEVYVIGYESVGLGDVR